MTGMAGLDLLGSMRRDPGHARRRLRHLTVRRALVFARPHRRDTVLFLAASVLSSIVAVTIPVLAGRAVNAISAQRPFAGIAGLALSISGLAVLEAALLLSQRWSSARIGDGIVLDLRTRVYDHVQRMPLHFFSRVRTGAMVGRLNGDIVGAQRAFTVTLSGVVGNIVILGLTAGVMAALSWQVTLTAVILLPAFLLPARRVGRRLAAITRMGLQMDAQMNSLMTERFTVSGALLVTLFGRADMEADRFAVRARRVRDNGVRSAVYVRTFFVILGLIAALAQALTYGWGGWLSLHGAMSSGTVVTLSLLLARLYGPLTELSRVRVDVMSALVSFERVFEVLDLTPSIAERPNAAAVSPGPPAVEFREVTFRFPAASEVSLASLEDVAALDRAATAPVLCNVSFTVRPGQTIALVGPSGAGKSTIAMLVPRIYDVSAGAVLLNGVDVRNLTLASLRRTVGVVTQDEHLFHDTIAENLRYAKPHATTADLWQVLDLLQLSDLINALPDRLDTMVGEHGFRFSGGERQRIAIARVLLKAPSLMIFDEATAHLDPHSEMAVQQAFNQASIGRTTLVIAHRLSTVRSADQILVLDAGRVVEQGNHGELLAHGGLYADLYRTQFTSDWRPNSCPTRRVT